MPLTLQIKPHNGLSITKFNYIIIFLSVFLLCSSAIANNRGNLPDSAKKTNHLFSAGVNEGIAFPFASFGINNSFNGTAFFAGCALPGYMGNAMLGIEIYKGWKLVIAGSYFYNNMNANKYLENTKLSDSSIAPYNIAAKGNYSYKQYSIFIGVAKDFEISNSIFAGFHILMGQFFANTPAVSGVADTSYIIWNPYQVLTGKMNLNLPAQKSSWRMLDYGMSIGTRVGWAFSSSFSLILSADYVFGESPNIRSLSSSRSINIDNINLFSYTLGIEYKFK
jgi:hypothetical protein